MMENNTFSEEAPGNNRRRKDRKRNSVWDILREAVVFKTRTKLLAIFALMFVGLFYANAMIILQMKSSNGSIESQGKIMAHQAMLSDAVGCFGSLKYQLAVPGGAKSASVAAADESEDDAKCDMDKFGSYLKNLETFSTRARSLEVQYAMLRDLPPGEMGRAYKMIAGIDEGLGMIAEKINQDSSDLSAHASSEAEKFRKFPVLFLVLGACGIALASAVILYNIFQPIENIISAMIDASHDPHNTKDYIMQRKDVAGEVGEVMQALDSLLLQVHEGFRRTEQAEQESAAAARQLDAVFNSVADGLITVDAEGEIGSLNKSAYGIFGYDKQSINEKKIGDLFPPAVSLRYMRSIQSFIGGSGSDLVDSGPKEMMGLQSGGGEIPIELSVTSIPLDGGHSIFVNVIRDITYRKNLERQLLQAQKMEALGSLSSGIAHEINTPAQYVRDNIKFMQEAFQAYDGFYKTVLQTKDTLPQEIRETITKQDIAFFSGEAPQALAQSLEGVARISEIVGAIKGFSYPATEDIVHIDLNAVLNNTIIVSRNQWKPFAQVRTEFDENVPPVPCFPGKLTQVILNLIVNATHAIEEKSRGVEDPEHNFITISTAVTKKTVVIRVADTGCGIPKENMSKIFNPFFTTKEVGKGTGQGLSISYDIIVKKHGGTLTAASEPGKGAVFTIELPMDIENAKGSSKGKKATAV